MPICSSCNKSDKSFSSAQLKKKSVDRKCIECVSQKDDMLSIIQKDSSIISISFEEKRKNLYTWLLKNNSILKVGIVNKDNYRSLTANERLAKNQNAVVIPHKCMMTMQNAKYCTLVKFIKDVSRFSAQTLLALYLLEEKYKLTESFFYPYICLLPENYHSMPLYFNENLVNELKSSHCQSMLIAQRLTLNQEYNNLMDQIKSIVTLDDFLWARTAVITRVFNCKINGISMECLVPVADLMNHALEPSLAWSFDDSLQGFKMTCLKPILKNMDLFDSYGYKCNSRYFINYGFTLPNNELSNQVALFFECPKICSQKRNYDNGFSGYDYLIQYKLEEWVSKYQNFRFQVPAILEHTCDVDKSLIQAMFGFLRSYVEFKEPNVETKFISEANELSVLNLISKNATLRLTNYCQDSKNADIARIVKSEKAVLNYYIDLNEFAQQYYDKLARHPIYKYYYKLSLL